MWCDAPSAIARGKQTGAAGRHPVMGSAHCVAGSRTQSAVPLQRWNGAGQAVASAHEPAVAVQTAPQRNGLVGGHDQAAGHAEMLATCTTKRGEDGAKQMVITLEERQREEHGLTSASHPPLSHLCIVYSVFSLFAVIVRIVPEPWRPDCNA